MNDIDINRLATYNDEVSRGIVHTPEWRAEMARLQADFYLWLADPEAAVQRLRDAGVPISPGYRP